MSLRFKFNLLLLSVFLVGIAVSTVILYQVSRKSAVEQIEAQIDVLRAQALAVRSYTSEEIQPILADTSSIQFLPQSVPSFSAQNVFSNFRDQMSQFYYKEAALNPTNPSDLATDWERELIEQLRADRSLERISTVRATSEGDQFTVAFPLEIKSEGCLTCHSTPERAPASMVALYGDQGGFGWQMNEIVGAQIFSAPLSIAEEQALRTLTLTVGAMSAVFLVILLLLNILLSRMVIRPVRIMASIAERVSMGDTSPEEYQREGSDEIASLSASFNRMRRSLDNAMKMLEDQ